VQPAFEARQIQKKSFRLAMSVGDKRHYVMDSIAPRHFQQDGDAAGLPTGSVDTILKELLDAAPGAIEGAVKSEPTEPALAKSIVAGVHARLRLVETALDAKARAHSPSSRLGGVRENSSCVAGRHAQSLWNRRSRSALDQARHAMMLHRDSRGGGDARHLWAIGGAAKHSAATGRLLRLRPRDGLASAPGN
jgi:hypothetical protein